MEKILPLRFFILFFLILSQYIITAQPNTLTISGTALIKQNLYLDDALILGQRSLPADPGSVNYDPLKGTMNVRNIFAGSSIQVGQEQVKFVINNTSSTILSGSVVAISGYDDIADAFEIKKSLANSVDNARVDGIVTTSMSPRCASVWISSRKSVALMCILCRSELWPIRWPGASLSFRISFRHSAWKGFSAT